MARKRERRLRRRIKAAVLSVAVLYICSSFISDDRFFRNLMWRFEIEPSKAATKNGKPIMHTFFSRIDPEVTTKNTGMSDEADAMMLATWKQAWEDAGWETKVLTIEDAMEHSNFHYFNTTLREFKYGKKFREYDVLCFFRWLALAMSGGGWSCDYDVFPLNPIVGGAETLPNDGMFTAYETIPRAAVPSFVSGTKEEYNRMSHLLVSNAAVHQGKEEFWTDFFSLIDVHVIDPDSYYIEDAVVPGQVVLTGKRYSQEDCDRITSGKMGAHFSHSAIFNGVTEEGETMEDRPKIALRFLKMWKEQCTNDMPFTPAALVPPEPDPVESNTTAEEEPSEHIDLVDNLAASASERR
uniref:Alpha 1,4-glycosyltransferase domain-containing protein n=1 Tax=Ditylum brightwellii TaxID=49249 RepID=A0A7S4QUY7_9STRA|mmetsp:Transcript_28679/g.42978  ORF Transcript_28679/g.42978 Transcript_28679/m.42978 type:complete len:353 (+) Transcript_28679:160-1218(+)